MIGGKIDINQRSCTIRAAFDSLKTRRKLESILGQRTKGITQKTIFVDFRGLNSCLSLT